jgi:hypothetical protein
MSKILYISSEIEPFESSWGSMCVPQSYNDGFIIPLGWEQELESRNINYEVIDYVVKEKEENESDN